MTHCVVNSYTLVWTDENDDIEVIGERNATGHYSGMLKYAQHGQVDILPMLPLEFITDQDLITFGAAVQEQSGSVAAILDIGLDEANVLDSMLCFERDIVLCVVFSVIAFCLVFLRKKRFRKRRPSGVGVIRRFAKRSGKSAWILFRLLFEQAFHEPSTLVDALMVLVYATMFMIFFFNWENTMTTEKVAEDRSKLIRSLDDVAANQSLKITMIEHEPMFEKFKRAPEGSIYQEIVRRVKVNESRLSGHGTNIESNMDMAYGAAARDRVFIMSKMPIYYSIFSLCLFVNKVHHVFVVNEGFFPYLMGSAHVTTLDKARRDHINKMMYRASESGVGAKIFSEEGISPRDYVIEQINFDKNIVNQVMRNCIVDSNSKIDDYVDKLKQSMSKDDLVVTTITTMAGVWYVVLIGTSVAVAVLCVEKLPRKRKVKARTVVRIVRALQ